MAIAGTTVFFSAGDPNGVENAPKGTRCYDETSNCLWVNTDGATTWEKMITNQMAASTTAKGIVELATDGESAANVAVQGNDARLSDSRTPTAHTASHKHGGGDEVSTATPGANAIPKADAGGKLDGWISDGSTTAKGKVELATDGENAANVVVQGNDSRLSDSRAPSGAAGGSLSGTYPNPGVADGADGTAIHDNTAAEISAITEKTTPVSADLLLIEDSAAANAKKKVQIGNLPAGAGANYVQSVFKEVTVDTSTTSITYVDLLSQAVTVSSPGILVITATASVNFDVNDKSAAFEIQIDGVSKRGFSCNKGKAAGAASGGVVYRATGVAAGSRTVKLRWKTDISSTAYIRPVTVDSESASLLIAEVKA